ncbi:MAG: hypothetical protein ABWZ41_04390 [Burkholderiales bacterium]
MDTILNLVAVAGVVGSLALVAWGMVLCLTHGLDAAEPVNADARWLNTNLPAGTLS